MRSENCTLDARRLGVGESGVPTVPTPMLTARLLLLVAGVRVQGLTHTFKGFGTNYVKVSGGTSAAPPVVLVHGFGGSSGQWRATLEDLAAAGRTVYAVDLLGFGDSPKPRLPADDACSIELWADQLQHFVDEVVVAEDGADQAVVVGNSIGSLACVCAAAANPPSIAGVGLFNCAIGMNSKAPPLPDDPVAYALFFNLIGAPPCDRPPTSPATRTGTTARVPRLQPRAPGLQPRAVQASRSSL